MTVRPAEPRDAEAWHRMRSALWPEGPSAEHREEIDRFFAGDFPRDPWAVLLAKEPDGRAIGFAELSVRPYAEGCRGTRVAYLEGWYVRGTGERREPHGPSRARFRGRGPGALLPEGPLSSLPA